MSNSAQRPNEPSPKFLQTLQKMSGERGVTFEAPTTTAQARRQFELLKKIPRLDRGQRHREDAAVREAVAAGTCAARVREEELAGYGSSARWA